MNKSRILAGLMAVLLCSISHGERMAPPKRDFRTNPPGKFLAPGYYIPNVFDASVVSISCSDGYRLSADSIGRKRTRQLMPSIIFLHESGKDRHSWYPMTVQLAGRGYNILSVDLRGCGENPVMNKEPGKTLDKLAEGDLLKMVEDVHSILNHLELNTMADPESIAIIGSGLGANLAIIAAAEPWAGKVRTVIAISPSLIDHGFSTIEPAKKLGRKLACLAASRGDTSTHGAATELYRILAGPKEFFDAEGDASGVAMFGSRSAVQKDGNGEPIVFFSAIFPILERGLHSKTSRISAPGRPGKN